MADVVSSTPFPPANAHVTSSDAQAEGGVGPEADASQVRVAFAVFEELTSSKSVTSCGSACLRCGEGNTVGYSVEGHRKLTNEFFMLLLT